MMGWSRNVVPILLSLLVPTLLAGCSRDRAGGMRAPGRADSVAAADSSISAAPGLGSEALDVGRQSAIHPRDDRRHLSPEPPRLSSAAADFPADSLERLSNQLIRWGVASTRGGTAPRLPASWIALLDRYGGICLGDTARKEIFLTFDAGYEAGYTSGLLDVLGDEGVEAAFFLTGHYLKTQPELVKRMVAEGHTVGNHTNSHLSMPSLDAAGMRAEMLAVASRFEALTGVGMTYFRPPSGELSERTLAVARRLGYVTVMWSLAYRDWEPVPGGSQESYEVLMARLHSGAVILLHVTSKDSAQALERMIKSAKEEGYAFGDLDELAGRRAQ